jgi:hypothetical protein
MTGVFLLVAVSAVALLLVLWTVADVLGRVAL